MNKVDVFINEKRKGIMPIHFGYQKCTAGYGFGPLIRPFWVLHYVMNGQGTFIRSGKKYRIQSGDIFIIPPYIETYYQADSLNPWNYVWIDFFDDGDNLPECFQQAVLRLPGSGKIFGEMRKSGELENGRGAFLVSKIYELISLALEKNATSNSNDYIEQAINLMNTEYMNNLTIESIASHLNIARSYFSTIFHQKMGISPVQYLINLRLEKAAELMVIHKAPPSTAAFSVGYSDLFHFSKAFKQKYGLSPRNYLKSVRETIT